MKSLRPDTIVLNLAAALFFFVGVVILPLNIPLALGSLALAMIIFADTLGGEPWIPTGKKKKVGLKGQWAAYLFRMLSFVFFGLAIGFYFASKT